MYRICLDLYRTILLLLILALAIPVTHAQPGYELPKSLKAEQLLSDELRSGKHHRLESQIRNDGLFNDYVLISDFGRFEIKTTTLLKIRIQEINAIARMRQIETGSTAAKALKQSGKDAATGAKNLVIHPVKTFGNAVTVVEQLYTRTTSTIRRHASDTEEGSFSQMVGLARAKGEIASQFGVNMYSRNAVLQQELDRLARAAFLGGLSAKVATSVASSFAPVMGSVLLSTSSAAQLLNDMINTTPPAEMWLQNKRKLLAMGLDLTEDKIENFLNQAVFSPAMQTVMVASLQTLDGVNGRALFVERALGIVDQNRARFITELAVMSAAYHKNIETLATFVPMAKMLSAVTQAGDNVVLLPADYMILSAQNVRVMNMVSSRGRSGGQGAAQFWILGQVSGKMRAHLLARGWHVHTQAGRMLQFGVK